MSPEAIALFSRQCSARLNGDVATYWSRRKPVNKILREAGENRLSVHLFPSGSAPALRAIKALSGKQRPQPPSCILSDGNPLKPLVCIAEYYKELLEIDPLITTVGCTGAVPLAPDTPP